MIHYVDNKRTPEWWHVAAARVRIGVGYGYAMLTSFEFQIENINKIFFDNIMEKGWNGYVLLH